LVFSTAVLRVPDMERNFVELVDELNGRGQFDFDIDFIVKTSFVLLDKGAKYDVDKLKDGKYAEKLQSDFESIKRALLSTLEFLQTDGKILCKRFLKSDLALIPIVDFVFHQPHQHLSEGQCGLIRQYLYMSFFMGFYSYGPDGKVDKIHNVIVESQTPSGFPLDKVGPYMSERTRLAYEFSAPMLYDLDLVLNIVQGGVAEIPQKRGWSLERDHIFPQSLLKKQGIPDELINRVGNLRLINKTRNVMKSDQLPEEDIEFFGSEHDSLRSLFLKARTNLTKVDFDAFLTKREELIRDRVNDFLQLPRK